MTYRFRPVTLALAGLPCEVAINFLLIPTIKPQSMYEYDLTHKNISSSMCHTNKTQALRSNAQTHN